MFGDNMLIAPVTKPSDGVYTEIEVWLPEGEWYELHTGTLLEGGRTLRRKFAWMNMACMSRPVRYCLSTGLKWKISTIMTRIYM